MQLLVYLSEEEIIEAEIVYRGSDDGWMIEDFHRCADHKGATVTLFKIKNEKDGDCMGGYTTQSWHHRSDDDFDKFFVKDD